ncbi:MAG: PH domain-containing protein [Proteobacteria bacterium]|nr:PH domain-containing protein [Pseudomonadota bacterium]
MDRAAQADPGAARGRAAGGLLGWAVPEVGGWSALLLVLPLRWFGWHLLARRYDVWVVTDRRVIDEAGVLSVSAMESPLSKINNVSYQQGLLGRLLGYGDVQIQTAAEMGATTYAQVAGPRRLKDTITRAQELQQERGAALQARQVAQATAPAGEGPTRGDTRSCPFCAEVIKAQATICRFCQPAPPRGRPSPPPPSAGAPPARRGRERAAWRPEARRAGRRQKTWPKESLARSRPSRARGARAAGPDRSAGCRGRTAVALRVDPNRRCGASGRAARGGPGRGCPRPSRHRRRARHRGGRSTARSGACGTRRARAAGCDRRRPSWGSRGGPRGRCRVGPRRLRCRRRRPAVRRRGRDRPRAAPARRSCGVGPSPSAAPHDRGSSRAAD